MVGRLVGLILAVLLVAAGVLWTLAGLGHAGRAGGGQNTLAIVGPAVAGLGLALGIVIVQHWVRGRR